MRPVLQQAIGPAAAGVLVGLTFPSVGATTVAVLFGVGLVLLVATRPTAVPADEKPAEHKHVLHDLREGFTFMTRTPWLLWTLLVASVYVLVVLGPIEVLMPFIAQQRFEDGPRAYGFIIAGFGIGSAVGALAVSSARMPRRYLTAMMAIWGLGALPLVVVGSTWSFPVMLAATILVGIGEGASMVIWGRCCNCGSPPRCWAGSRASTSSSRWCSCRCHSPSPDRCRKSFRCSGFSWCPGSSWPS